MNPSFRTQLDATRVSRRFIFRPSVSKPSGQGYGFIKSFTRENSDPPYATPAVLQATQRSPGERARMKLNAMTALDADWGTIGSDPPNDAARQLAFRVLELSYSNSVEPSLVTASAEGGVGIVYKAPGKYAAIECLNRGRMQLLWFSQDGEPQVRRIKKIKKDIKEALEQVAALYANA